MAHIEGVGQPHSLGWTLDLGIAFLDLDQDEALRLTRISWRREPDFEELAELFPVDGAELVGGVRLPES